MKILAIDPGYERVGIAILEKSADNPKEILLFSECFKTSKDLKHHERVSLISEELVRLIEDYGPEALAIESLFFNKNQKTVMNVSEARGAIINTCAEKGLDVFEYTPLQIKMAVTSNGRSDKKAVMSMVPLLIDLKKEIKSDDEFDAVATGLTHFAVSRRS